jgi:lactam utilization protein B
MAKEMEEGYAAGNQLGHGRGFQTLYHMGDDEGMMPHITVANVACGFHASDPVVMHETVRLAKRFRVRVDAHPPLPDLQGFGRREMKVGREELRDYCSTRSAPSPPFSRRKE